MYVQPLEGSLGSNTLSSLTGNVEGEIPAFTGSAAPPSGDNISRFVPPWLGDGATASGGEASGSMQGLFGPLMGMLAQLMQMLQSLMGYGGCGSSLGGGSKCAPYGGERFFQNATGSSEGDPHLSFNGSKWKSMASQPDLLSSDSFAGGYRVSTQATAPNGRGVTWNRSATIALNNGATKVSLNDEGRAAITSYGQTISIARGQTVNLGDGESVTYEDNGALSVTAQNESGGRISTTLTAKNNGVDVDATAHDVDLGGALVEGTDPGGSTGSLPGPIPSPWPGPVTDPYGFAPQSSTAQPVAYPEY